MKQKEFKIWQKYHKMGQLKYILLWTVYFVITVNVVMLGSNVIKGNFTFKIEDFIIRTIIGALFGAVSGDMTWERNEREYANYLKKSDSI